MEYQTIKKRKDNNFATTLHQANRRKHECDLRAEVNKANEYCEMKIMRERILRNFGVKQKLKVKKLKKLII